MKYFTRAISFGGASKSLRGMRGSGSADLHCASHLCEQCWIPQECGVAPWRQGYQLWSNNSPPCAPAEDQSTDLRGYLCGLSMTLAGRLRWHSFVQGKKRYSYLWAPRDILIGSYSKMGRQKVKLDTCKFLSVAQRTAPGNISAWLWGAHSDSSEAQIPLRLFWYGRICHWEIPGQLLQTSQIPALQCIHLDSRPLKSREQALKAIPW